MLQTRTGADRSRTFRFHLCRVAACSAVLCLAAGQQRGIAAGATTSLHQWVTVDGDLSEAARRALVREASAIWRQSAVLLVWDFAVDGAATGWLARRADRAAVPQLPALDGHADAESAQGSPKGRR